MKSQTTTKRKTTRKKAMTKPALSRKILAMAKKDQDVREIAITSRSKNVFKQLAEIDALHLAEIKKIIQKHGWPKISQVGERAAGAFWLLVQHADADAKFQRQCLRLLKEAVKKQEAAVSRVAYLTDRVLLAEGKKQRYGTQYFQKIPGGPWLHRPVEKPEELEARRKKFGLRPIEEEIAALSQYMRKTK